MSWLLALSALAPTHALASTFREVPSFDQLVERAAAVVEGEVVGLQTRPCSLGLCTTYEVVVLTRWKGDGADTVELTLPGGRRGGLTQRASGVPLWAPGSNVILFVSDEGTIPLTGLLTLTGDQLEDPLRMRRLPASIYDFEEHLRDHGSVRSGNRPL